MSAGGMISVGRIAWVMRNKTKGEGSKYEFRLFSDGTAQILKEDKVIKVFVKEEEVDSYFEDIQYGRITLDGDSIKRTNPVKPRKETQIEKTESNLESLFDRDKSSLPDSDAINDAGSAPWDD